MKIQLLFFMVCCSLGLNAQSALYNTGNLQIHQDGQLGLHIDLINNGVLDANLGQAGFYGDLPLSVSGAFSPTFFNVEISNPEHVLLNTGINTTNTTNFILGNFETLRSATDNYFNFITDAAYTNSGDITKIDGYAAVTNKQNFTFPIGDATQLRPLVLNAEGINTIAKCAYFFENPSSATTFTTNFNSALKAEGIDQVSTVEFWHLEGSVATTVQLSWNERSNIGAVTNDANAVTVVGWSKTTNQWESLAGGASIGDITLGFVSSSTFVPDDYEILTLASTSEEPSEFITVDNYLVTANGDGINDALVIDELTQSPNNSMMIFDRFGLKVFEKENYTNEFEGFSNTGLIPLTNDDGLPTGVYFFLVEMRDLDLDFQGFLYLSR